MFNYVICQFPSEFTGWICHVRHNSVFGEVMYENFFHIISRYIQVFSISSDSMEAIIDCSQNRTVNTTFFYNTYLMILSEFSNHKILNGPKVKNDVLNFFESLS